MKKLFNQTLFGWGRNKHNCGYKVNLVKNEHLGDTPHPLSSQINSNVVKSVSGYSESIMLTQEGKIYSFGLDKIIPGNQDSPVEITFEGKILDCDLDKSNAIFLGEYGNVYTIEKEGRFKHQITGACKVACGDNFFLVVVQNGNNSQDIVMWQTGGFDSSEFIFCGQLIKPQDYHVIEKASNILKKEQSKVKKVLIVEHAIVMLLENGKLFSWGSNQYGNLGLKRSLQDSVDFYEMYPGQPMKLIQNTNKVVDFALSNNILVVLDEKNNAYYSGLSKDFLLEKINFFPNQKITAIGASFNNYFLIDEDGKVYQRENLEAIEYPLFYGDLGLYQIEDVFFNAKKVHTVGGKYDNVLAHSN